MREKGAREISKKHKEDKVQEPMFSVGDRTINYHVYYMSALEKILYFVLAFCVGAAVGYLFYGGIGKDEYGDPTMLTNVLNMVIMVFCGFMAGKLFLPVRNK